MTRAQATAVVELDDVTKLYKQGSVDVHALRGLSLLIDKAEFAKHLHCGRQLPLPAVNHDQIRRRSLLLQETSIASAYHLAHAGKIIGAVCTSDLKLPVFTLPRPAVDKYHHRGDGFRSLNGRDIKTLNAPGELRKPEVLLQ